MLFDYEAAMNWTCPYCDKAQTVTVANHFKGQMLLDIGVSASGPIHLQSEAISCANEDCRRATVLVRLINYKGGRGKTFLARQLMPESAARPQPDCIPAALREDYAEACLVRDLSPKASATLARRCLQGMIRDFCGISKPTLFKEIAALKQQVDEGNAPRGVSIESVEAIDYIRQIGNIGAHMEKDINIIVDVDSDEAQVLIELIETLFDEWYVARARREERFAKVKQIADEKAQQKLLAASAVGDEASSVD
ncbi:DUF4145 domain-containing protein [Thalassobius sp. Cn5-15]|uniref:DUF4145 domain-containing protein n=1 Tax=Thalassobius sp. Cn5-15 TaxID=2917763 RepID=UPI001EF332C5|nr:DUF4145 domain-containing protein [Thalassobius sp. Cn5-15]MCG7493357.1 DUF4145 domain-containing protein [Thalassobius sp. Cn5-15]